MRAVFFDRDGVINVGAVEGDYVKSWDEFEFMSGIFPLMKVLSERGFKLFVITNQRGVDLKVMTEADLEDIHNRMMISLKDEGIKIEKVYACVHGKDQCECRKPKPGMILKAAAEFGIDLAASYMVGDRESDMKAAEAAGVGKGIFFSLEQKLEDLADSIF
jgi:D-glycero-D-manno-heptose 1,7-bisphosphate phosphatase